MTATTLLRSSTTAIPPGRAPVAAAATGVAAGAAALRAAEVSAAGEESFAGCADGARAAAG